MLNVRPTMPKARPAAGSGPAFGSALIGRFTRLAPLGSPVWKLIGKPLVAGGIAGGTKPGEASTLGPIPKPPLTGTRPITVLAPCRHPGWIGTVWPPGPGAVWSP